MIQIRDALRFNIYSPAAIDGVRYPDFTDRSLWPSLGISEVAPPAPPAEYLTNPNWYVVTEQDEAPYVVYTRLTDAQIADQLVAIKAAKNAEINASRLAANRGTFTHGGKSFACDELSRSDIDGVTSFVTLAGSLPPGWPGAWKAVDNSYLPISSVAEWAAFVASMVAAGNANFAKAQALKAQLAAATATSQIQAIVW